MRLYEFKALYMSRLSLYNPRSEKERELVNSIISKLNYLRTMNLPTLVHTVHLILEYEDVSGDLKSLLREMLRDVTKLDFKSE